MYFRLAPGANSLPMENRKENHYFGVFYGKILLFGENICLVSLNDTYQITSFQYIF